MNDQKTCAKCGRTGTHQFKQDGESWVCTAKLACQGRRHEAAAAKPEERTCELCGRVGKRQFVPNKFGNGWLCESRWACRDRQAERELMGAGR